MDDYEVASEKLVCARTHTNVVLQQNTEFFLHNLLQVLIIEHTYINESKLISTTKV